MRDTILKAETVTNRKHRDDTLVELVALVKPTSGCQWEVRTTRGGHTGSGACRTLAAAERKFRSCVTFAANSKY
jgi:hypothetical protein